MASIPQNFLADLDAIFNSPLAVDVQHINAGNGINETLRAFYDTEYEILFDNRGFSTGIEISSETPQILLRTAEAANVQTDSQFVIDGETFYVFDLQPDLHGVKRILLTKDATK
jgi:hypothetical protein